MRERTSSEAPDVVDDVTDEEAPPNNERKDSGQGCLDLAALIDTRLTPADPICRQHAQADHDEIFLEIEETERVPVPVALQVGLNINLEVEVDDRPKQCGAHVQNRDGIGVSRRLHGAEAAEDGTWTGAGWRPYRQRLMRDRAEQCDRDEPM